MLSWETAHPLGNGEQSSPNGASRALLRLRAGLGQRGGVGGGGGSLACKSLYRLLNEHLTFPQVTLALTTVFMGTGTSASCQGSGEEVLVELVTEWGDAGHRHHRLGHVPIIELALSLSNHLCTYFTTESDHSEMLAHSVCKTVCWKYA